MTFAVTRSLLLGVSAAAGFFLLAATMLLVGMRRIYIDKETKKPIEFEFPIIGKVKSQTPALFLIAGGMLLVVYPIQQSGPDQVTIQGTVTAPPGVRVDVVAVPQQFQTTLYTSGPFSMTVPLIPNANYRVQYQAGGVIADQQGVLVKDQILVTPWNYGAPPADSITPVKEVSDAELQKLGIH